MTKTKTSKPNPTALPWFEWKGHPGEIYAGKPIEHTAGVMRGFTYPICRVEEDDLRPTQVRKVSRLIRAAPLLRDALRRLADAHYFEADEEEMTEALKQAGRALSRAGAP